MVKLIERLVEGQRIIGEKAHPLRSIKDKKKKENGYAVVIQESKKTVARETLKRRNG